MTSAQVAEIKGIGERRTSIPRRNTLLFAATSFLSAFLLFQVQLIVSKYILPWFGGSAAVWSTSLLVFQLLLLAGYLYSHVLSARLSPTAQTKLHLGLLTIVSLLVIALQIEWPSAITPSATWKPSSTDNPALAVGILIAIACGIPFFVLSTTGPLLQRWYANLGSGTKTYKLYSISNLGSLLGLLTFPLLFEPLLRIRTQGILWALLFLVFAAGTSLCALQARRSNQAAQQSASNNESSVVSTTLAIRILWFLLPAAASALLLSTTNLLCQEVTSVPLLWVFPLALYLLTFIFSFEHPRWYQRWLFQPVFVLGLLLISAALVYDQPLVQLVTLPIVLFAGCMICHGELFRIRPAVDKLTAFYLAIAAGGAAGGTFVALVAPRVFTFFTEFQISLAACLVLALACLWLDSESWLFARDFRRPLAIGFGMIVAAVLVGQNWPQVATLWRSLSFYPIALVIVFLVVLGAHAFRNAGPDSIRGFRFGQILPLAIAILSITALVRSTQPLPGLFLSARNFYGAIRVFNVPHGRMLMHGRTIHGGQFDSPFDREPATYYGRQSGIGAVMLQHPKRLFGDGKLRVELIGLGSGTLAAYGRPGDYFRYYEINPKVVSLSTAPRPIFTYVRDSAARVDILLGDARLLMERETFSSEAQKYDVLVVDAFSGDAIPVHLLTREAFDIYWQHLNSTNGIIAIHVSSRHVDLLPVIRGAAEHFHAESLIYFDAGGGPFLANCWVLLSRQPGVLDSLGIQQNLPPNTNVKSARLWTDDYSDIATLLKK